MIKNEMHFLLATAYCFGAAFNMEVYMRERQLFNPIFILFLISVVCIIWLLWTNGYRIAACILIYKLTHLLVDKFEECNEVPRIGGKEVDFLVPTMVTEEGRILGPAHHVMSMHAFEKEEKKEEEEDD